MIYSESMFQSGVWKIKNLFDQQGKYLELNSFKNKGLSGNDFMLLNSVFGKFPCRWKQQISHVDSNCDNSCILIKGKCKSIIKVSSKELTNILILLKLTKSKSNNKLSKDFNINNEQWKSIYTLCSRVLSDNRVIVMQFQVLHNCILTNKLLFKMNLVNNSMCNFCNMYVQDLYHLFFDCFIIKNFWFAILSWYNTKNRTKFKILRHDAILGHKLEDESLDREIMLAKYFIFTSKFRNERPTLNSVFYFQKKQYYEL